MKKFIVVTLALICATLANAVNAEGTSWNKWSVAPYANSFGEACKKMPATINGFNMPQTVKEHFIEMLGTDCKGGTEVWLTPHQGLEQMWSGGQRSHVMNQVTVGELPVLKSPDGRSYRKGSVAETAKALSWTFAYEGKTYVLYVPFVCFNVAWAFGPPARKLVEDCYELVFNGPVRGYVSWGIGTTTGPFPPSECNAQKEGDGSWKAWYGICPDCILPGVYLDYMRKDLGQSAQIPHKYRYPATQTQQVLRFSSAVLSADVYICLTDDNGKNTCGVVVMRPQDWKGRHRVVVSDSLWIWEGDSRCPPTQ